MRLSPTKYICFSYGLKVTKMNSTMTADGNKFKRKIERNYPKATRKNGPKHITIEREW